ncbi:aldo/keto reductase [candidate division KSB1 bacterium]|nr:aldo/keto reductase [candidate division KSB1 bacterium]
MMYRNVPKTNWRVSELSFGCMRFKDEDTAIEVIRKAIESGVNYFDVAPLYGNGTAEVYLGKGIRGLRDKVIVTAKSSPGNGGEDVGEYNPETGFGIRTADQARRQIERSMKILGVDHLDMYQFWALHGDSIFEDGIKRGGFMDGVLKAKDEGLFDYIGMTTHSHSADIIRYIKDSPYEFDMVTLPFNLIHPERTEAIAYCAERGIGVVAMNPLAGGQLAKSVPIYQKIASNAGCDSMIEAALRFIIGQPGATVALNGITYIDHVLQGTAAIEKGTLEMDTQARLLSELGELYSTISPDRLCSQCRYCGKCPEGILIPEVLEIYTNLQLPAFAEDARQHLGAMIKLDPEGYDPAACTACRQCEEKCPNKLPVSEMMAAAAELWRMA